MLTKTDEEFLKAKKTEFQKQRDMFGYAVEFWDMPKFLGIIASLQRDNRRLRVQLNQKEKI